MTDTNPYTRQLYPNTLEAIKQIAAHIFLGGEGKEELQLS
jgi:hypothetical protein